MVVIHRAAVWLLLVSAGAGWHPDMRAFAAQNPAPLSAPAGTTFFGLTPQFAVSPDGRLVVSVVTSASGVAMLWLRALSDGRTPGLLASTEQASYPFWSPDSRSIGFFANGKLKALRLGSGPAIVVCDAPTGRGGTWNAEDTMVFASGIGDPLRRVYAGGGQVIPVTTIDTSSENSHRWPQFLPDGQHILFWAGAGRAPPQLKIASLASSGIVSVGPSDTNGVFGAGQIFYGSKNVLMALPFDAATLRARGDPVRVVEPLSGDAGSNFGSFSVSTTGTLLFTRGTALPLVLTWLDRSGKKLGTVGAPGQYTNVALSPDDRRIAVSLTAGAPPNRDIWILDASTGAPTRLTSDPAVDATPIWSADGKEILFSSQRAGPYQIFRRPSTAGGNDWLVFASDVPVIATDWSRDGRSMAFTRQFTWLDVWTGPIFDTRAPNGGPIGGSTSPKDNGVLSPDGRWIAYQSNVSDRAEIYVRQPGSFSEPPAFKISKDGGTQPLWRADGKELFFLAPDGAVMSAAVNSGEAPRKLFSAPISLVIRRSYSVTSDGQRFLMPLIDSSNPPTITVVTNWSAASSR